MPKLSVIIPCYNCAQTLQETVDSIDTQELDIPFEIIAVDDGSTDQTSDLLKRIVRGRNEMRIITHEQSRRGGAARITGIRAAKGYLIYCLDSYNILSSV